MRSEINIKTLVTILFHIKIAQSTNALIILDINAIGRLSSFFKQILTNYKFTSCVWTSSGHSNNKNI